MSLNTCCWGNEGESFLLLICLWKTGPPEIRLAFRKTAKTWLFQLILERMVPAVKKYFYWVIFLSGVEMVLIRHLLCIVFIVDWFNLCLLYLRSAPKSCQQIKQPNSLNVRMNRQGSKALCMVAGKPRNPWILSCWYLGPWRYAGPIKMAIYLELYYAVQMLRKGVKMY